MTYRNSSVAIAAAAAVAAFVPAIAAEQPAAAPLPGSPGSYVAHCAVAAQLAKAIAASQDPAVAPMAITDQYLINEVHRGKVAPPAVHPGWTELHLVLEGSATFVTGGQIIAATAGSASSIEGGISRKVEKGDAVVVPPNTPHWYKQIDGGGITVVEVRFMAPATTAGATK
jgi:mannose-6-phosphate isomerase-like protein (cupin superfamily)